MKLWTLASAITILVLSSSVNAALVSRLNGQAFYDDVLDITWLADANLAATQNFGVSFIRDGAMAFNNAYTWLNAMNSYEGAGYLGFNDWRLPSSSPVDGVAFSDILSINGSTDTSYNISAVNSAYPDTTVSELSYMFYNNLSNQGSVDVSGQSNDCRAVAPDFCLSNTGPFSNLQAADYWIGTPLETGFHRAARFDFRYGLQNLSTNPVNHYVWAVRDGDVTVVPLPAAVWLFGSGLIGLVGFAKRKKA